MLENPAKQARNLMKKQMAERRRAMPRSEVRGWQLVNSGGTRVWQWIRGGKHQPVQRRQNDARR